MVVEGNLLSAVDVWGISARDCEGGMVQDPRKRQVDLWDGGRCAWGRNAMFRLSRPLRILSTGYGRVQDSREDGDGDEEGEVSEGAG